MVEKHWRCQVAAAPLNPHEKFSKDLQSLWSSSDSKRRKANACYRMICPLVFAFSLHLNHAHLRTYVKYLQCLPVYFHLSSAVVNLPLLSWRFTLNAFFSMWVLYCHLCITLGLFIWAFPGLQTPCNIPNLSMLYLTQWTIQNFRF